MATDKSKSIDNMNMREIIGMMEALEVSFDGVETLDEMKSRVKAVREENTPSWSAGQAFTVISEAEEEGAKKRRNLLEFYTKANAFLGRMDKQMITLLQKYTDSVIENMNLHIEQLKETDNFLVVTGETSSGKSRLINLILGEEILPYSLHSTMSTILELKFGQERRMVVHFKDRDPKKELPTKEILLEQPTGSREESYLEQISSYVKPGPLKGSIVKKVELFWPHKVLQAGLVIIDSPVVGESEEVDEMVVQYLPKAFAFMYVINSSNGSGIEKDRLEKLLQRARNVFSKEGKKEGWLSLNVQEDMLSKSTLFICNKWDAVQEQEVQSVKGDVIKKLKRVWPGIDPESQIIYMSTTKATTAQNSHGVISKEFSSLMDGMRSVILSSIEAKLELHWNWLYTLISRIVVQSKVFTTNATRSKEEINQEKKEISHRLDVIEKDQKKMIHRLRALYNEQVNHVQQQLQQDFSSREDKNEDGLSLTEFAKHWGEENQIFVRASFDLSQKIQNCYDDVEFQLQNLQSMALTGDFQEFSENDSGYFSMEVKDTRMTNEEPRKFVSDKLGDAKLFLDEIEKDTSAQIEAFRELSNQLSDELSEETGPKEKTKDRYQPIFTEGSKLKGELALFGIKDVCAVRINRKTLDWKEENSSCLGSGAFGAVYKGTMRRGGEVTTVALKVSKKPLKAVNASEIMQEIRILRKLSHPHIVKFYGISFDMSTFRMVLVMEKCKGNLKKHIFQELESPPDVLQKCRWVREITDGLAFIHATRVVHRDLKLENILLSEENTVKIADVGLAKAERDITGTVTGTPLYMAPEVFRRSKVYDSKADIYSLGLIMWEMWYGQEVFADAQISSKEALYQWVGDKANRPVHREGWKTPPHFWEQLMKQCWDGNPDKRPTAKECNQTTVMQEKEINQH